jgi:peroxiredoxin
LNSNAEQFALSPGRAGRHSLSVVILAFLLMCSALLNVVLAKKVKNLNQAILHIKTELSAARGLNQGGKAPPIQGKDIDGQPITIAQFSNSSSTVIYIFSPTCMWCSRNLDNIKMLFTQIKKNYRFVGLSLSSESLKEYVLQSGLEFPVYTDLAGQSAVIYKGGTPRTLVVSSDGIVLKSWFGAYTGDLQREIEGYFKTQLPGVTGTESKEKQKGQAACDVTDQETTSHP